MVCRSKTTPKTTPKQATNNTKKHPTKRHKKATQNTPKKPHSTQPPKQSKPISTHPLTVPECTSRQCPFINRLTTKLQATLYILLWITMCISISFLWITTNFLWTTCGKLVYNHVYNPVENHLSTTLSTDRPTHF